MRYEKIGFLWLLSLSVAACGSDSKVANVDPPANSGNTTPDNTADNNNDGEGADEETATPETPEVAVVDCNSTLPCTWKSSDTGISVTFTNVDSSTNDSNGLLTAYLEMETTRDTTVSLLRSGGATSTSGTTFTPYTRLLGDSGIQSGNATAQGCSYILMWRNSQIHLINSI